MAAVFRRHREVSSPLRKGHGELSPHNSTLVARPRFRGQFALVTAIRISVDCVCCGASRTDQISIGGPAGT